MLKIKWVGRNTAMNIKWEAEADSYRDLWYELLEKRVVHDDEYDRYVFNKEGVTEDDFKIDNDWDTDKYDEFMSDVMLDEDEWKDLIESCDGNAYYQYFYEFNEETQKYEEV